MGSRGRLLLRPASARAWRTARSHAPPLHGRRGAAVCCHGNALVRVLVNVHVLVLVHMRVCVV